MGDGRMHFQHDLLVLEARTLNSIDVVVGVIGYALDALRAHDAFLARVVAVDRARVETSCLDVHHRVLSLIARQAPVAGDLRFVASLLHVVKHVERIGDQCASIATMVPLLGDRPPIDAGIAARIDAMGAQAQAQVRQARRSFAQRDVALATDLVGRDDTLDTLNREVFRRAIDVGGRDATLRGWATTMMLVARALERIGDNAVDIGEQTAFVVTGRLREPAPSSEPLVRQK